MQISSYLSDQLQNYLDLSSQQLKITAGNMANVSTAGYTRQAVVFEEAAPLTLGSRVVSTGVVAEAAISQRDRILNQSLDQQTQAQAATSSRLGALESLGTIFSAATSTSSTATSSDISSGLNSFFGSLQQLEADPANPTLRGAMLADSSTLTDSFNSAASNLKQQQSGLNGQVASIVSQVNSLSGALATLNAQITSVSPGTDAGALEDERQLDLNSLSKLIGIQQVNTGNNSLMVTTTGGAVLVSGSQSTPLTTGVSNGVNEVFSGTTKITGSLASGDGQLGGLLQVRDHDIPGAMASLDSLAFSFGTAVNTVNQAGTDANGVAGKALFALPASASGSAAGISVLINDPLGLAAANSGGGAGDSGNASVMAGLQQKALVNGQTVTGFYASFVSSLGSLTASVSADNTAREAAVTQLQTQQSNLSSVSLDNEATSLQNLEQAYQAASKVFTVINTLMSAAMNLGIATAV